MKTKVKNEKGITLVALIITIIVLVILATVAIATITNTGMVEYSIKGAQDYSDAQKEEESRLQNIQETMEEAINGGNYVSLTLIAGEGITDVLGTGKYKVGQEVNIDAVVSTDTTVDTEWIYEPTSGEIAPVAGNERYQIAHGKEWKEWTKDGETYSTTKNGTVIIPEGGLTLTAVAEDSTSHANTEEYKVVSGEAVWPNIVFYAKFANGNNTDNYTGYLMQCDGSSQLLLSTRSGRVNCYARYLDGVIYTMREKSIEESFAWSYGVKISNRVETSPDNQTFRNTFVCEGHTMRIADDSGLWTQIYTVSPTSDTRVYRWAEKE